MNNKNMENPTVMFKCDWESMLILEYRYMEMYHTA